RQAAATATIPARWAQVEALAAALAGRGIPLQGIGAGSLFLDARRWLPRVPAGENPAQALVALIFLRSGVRSIGTPAGQPDAAQVVRIAVRDGTAPILQALLPEVYAFGQAWTSGLRAEPWDGVPFLGPLAPCDPGAWPEGAPVMAPPGVDRAFDAGDWPRLERALRERLGLDPGWTLVPAPRQRGPQRLLAEAWSHLNPGGDLRSDDPVLRHTWAWFQARGPAGGAGPTLHDVPPARLEKALAQRRPGDATLVRLGRLASWPAGGPCRHPRAREALAWWACDFAAEQGAGGGVLAFPAASALARRILDTMIWAVGAPSDGGLSAASIAALADVLERR
ncbi:MAG: hypothetical protein ABIO70_12165, partial [Pseudomonadota bacterium]